MCCGPVTFRARDPVQESALVLPRPPSMTGVLRCADPRNHLWPWPRNGTEKGYGFRMGTHKWPKFLPWSCWKNHVEMCNNLYVCILLYIYIYIYVYNRIHTIVLYRRPVWTAFFFGIHTSIFELPAAVAKSPAASKDSGSPFQVEVSVPETWLALHRWAILQKDRHVLIISCCTTGRCCILDHISNIYIYIYMCIYI